MKKFNLIHAILIGIILVMGYFMIFKQPAPVIKSSNDVTLENKINIADSTAKHWKRESEAWHNLANVYGDKNDSLENLKMNIKNYYDEKYTFNANADAHKLDSVIRANW